MVQRGPQNIGDSYAKGMEWAKLQAKWAVKAVKKAGAFTIGHFDEPPFNSPFLRRRRGEGPLLQKFSSRRDGSTLGVFFPL
jgi:hypothetical protein